MKRGTERMEVASQPACAWQLGCGGIRELLLHAGC